VIFKLLSTIISKLVGILNVNEPMPESQRQHKQRQINPHQPILQKKCPWAAHFPYQKLTFQGSSESCLGTQSTGALPLKRNNHSNPFARSPLAPNLEGAVFSNETEDEDSQTTLDPLDHTMRLSDDTAKLATQHPTFTKAPPLRNVPARMPIGGAGITLPQKPMA
jgi:hypothetical protein